MHSHSLDPINRVERVQVRVRVRAPSTKSCVIFSQKIHWSLPLLSLLLLSLLLSFVLGYRWIEQVTMCCEGRIIPCSPSSTALDKLFIENFNQYSVNCRDPLGAYESESMTSVVSKVVTIRGHVVLRVNKSMTLSVVLKTSLLTHLFLLCPPVSLYIWISAQMQCCHLHVKLAFFSTWVVCQSR